MERLCQETRLNCEGNVIVKHPDPYDGAVHLVTSGQGIVFLAYDYEQGKHVVIKKPRYELREIRHLQNQEQLAKYELAKNVYREFELGTLVKHKNIMSILDAYTPDTTFQSFKNIYLVFELMDKRDLRFFHCEKWNEICDHQNGAILVADLMLQLFSAVAYLHQDKLRLIHRDIKPDNILIKQDGNGYVVKLGDLGHARQISPIEGQPMTMNITTCQYRAPEVMQNKIYSTPIDIWSVGCVLAEILMPPNPQNPNALFNSNDAQIVSQMHNQLTENTISTKFANEKLPQWKNVEKWGEYFRYILENTLKMEPNERLKAADLLELNPFEMLNMEKYRFEPVSEAYMEKAEDLRKPNDWRMKIYDKLKDYNQKRNEEIHQRQNGTYL